MARTQTMVQLTDDLVRMLDQEAARRGVSRSALIRTAIDELLVAIEDDSVGRAIVDGYRRVPPGRPDGWGDLERQTDRAHVETLLRLDEEERAAGLSWT